MWEAVAAILAAFLAWIMIIILCEVFGELLKTVAKLCGVPLDDRDAKR